MKSITTLIFVGLASLASIQSLAQDDCSTGFSAARVTGENVVTDIPAQGWVPQGGDALDLSEDGQAALFVTLNKAGPSRVALKYQGLWNLGDRCEINLQFSSGSNEFFDFISDDNAPLIERYGFEPAVIEFFVNAGIFELPIKEELVSRTLTRLSTNADTDQVGVASRYRYTFDEQFLVDSGWVGDSPVGVIESTRDQVLYAADSLQNVIPAKKKLRGTWAFSTITPARDANTGEEIKTISTDQFVFQRIGNQTISVYGQKPMRWSQSDSEITLFDDEEAFLIKPFASDGTVYTALTSHYVRGELQSKFVEWVANVKGNAVNFPGRLVKQQPKLSISRINSWKQSAFDANGELNAIEVFGYNFKSDGSMARNFGVEGGFDCIDISAPCFFFELNNWTWQSSSSQVVLMRSLPGQERVRTWDVLSSARGKTAVMESTIFKLDGNNDGDFDDPEDYVAPLFPTRVNVLSTFDPSKLSDAWFNSRRPAQRLRSQSLSVDKSLR